MAAGSNKRQGREYNIGSEGMPEEIRINITKLLHLLQIKKDLDKRNGRSL